MPLAAAARFHLRHHFLQRNRATGEHVLKFLPDLLQADLLYEMRAPLLRYSRFMKHLDSTYSALAKRLCGNTLAGRCASPDEIIFAQGDPCNEALCLEDGYVLYNRVKDGNFVSWGEGRRSVVHAESSVDFFVHMRAPAWFCEAAIWVSWQNLGSLRSRSHSSLMKLDAVVFRSEVCHFPQALADAICYARFYADGVLELLEEELCTDRGLDHDRATNHQSDFRNRTSSFV